MSSETVTFILDRQKLKNSIKHCCKNVRQLANSHNCWQEWKLVINSLENSLAIPIKIINVPNILTQQFYVFWRWTHTLAIYLTNAMYYVWTNTMLCTNANTMSQAVF